MFNWLKRTNKEEVPNICKYESSTGDCSLIQQLKEKQAAKKKIDEDIKAYESNSPLIAQSIRKFFIALEKRGLEMDHYYHRVDKMFDHHYATCIVANALYDLSLEDVESLISEIQSIKQKAVVLEEKRLKSQVLGQNIADIKERLGIE